VMHAWIEPLGAALEALGVALLTGGLLFGFARALRDGPHRYQRLRHDLGRSILLGLEVLVAADIVRSVALAPSMGGLAVLAAIVAIRTFLSWSLTLELDGRWPWQPQTASVGAQRPFPHPAKETPP
jgi:uncharacterized membrane protein